MIIQNATGEDWS